MKEILDQIETLSAELLQCLTQEHEALNQNQLDQLVTLSEQKQLLVTQLNHLDQQRLSICNQNDFMTYLNDLDSSLVSHWQLVTESIQKCQQQNEINGLILNRRNLLARETLEIFTGNKADNNHTYGADGLQTGNSSMVTNVEA